MEDPKEVADTWLPYAEVEPAFFETLQIPIVAGRGFTEDDRREATNVIVDRPMARFLYGEQNPVGRRFRYDRDGEPWLTIVGVVEDVKLMGPDDRNGAMDFFYPLPRDALRDFMSLILRTRSDPTAAMASIRGVVRQLDPTLPVWRLFTAEESLAESVDEPRFFLLMMAIFAVVALGLAAVGTYGVLAFAVRQRHRELGVRAALGADSGRLKAMILREGLWVAGAGVGIGVAGAIGLGRVARTLLFEVEPTDPLTLAAVTVLMLATTALASWIPARRATQVDPVEVLRAQ